MSNFIDLDLLADETITFKIGGKNIEIPSSPKTALVIKIMDLENKVNTAETPEDQVSFLTEIVSLILSQGEEKINKKFVQDNFHISQQKKVVEVYRDNMNKIEKNPN